MTEDEMYDIIYGYEESERDFHERNIELENENEKLRELVRKWYPHMLKRVGRDALEQWGQMEVVRELGIEVPHENG